MKERKRKIASLRAARCKRWGKRGRTRIWQATRKEVVKKRGKFGTSADVLVAMCVTTMGFFFLSLSHETLDFRRETRKFEEGEMNV